MTVDNAVHFTLMGVFLILGVSVIRYTFLNLKTQSKSIGPFTIQIVAISLLIPLIAFLGIYGVINDQAITTLLGVVVGYVFTLGLVRRKNNKSDNDV